MTHDRNELTARKELTDLLDQAGIRWRDDELEQVYDPSIKGARWLLYLQYLDNHRAEFLYLTVDDGKLSVVRHHNQMTPAASPIPGLRACETEPCPFETGDLGDPLFLQYQRLTDRRTRSDCRKAGHPIPYT